MILILVIIFGLTGVGMYDAGYRRGFDFRERIAQVELLLASLEDEDSRLQGANPLDATFCGQAELAHQRLAPLIKHQSPNRDGYFDSAIDYELGIYDEACQSEPKHATRHTN